MAFGNGNSNTGNNNSNNVGNNGGKQFEAAVGFINFYLPVEGGGRKKIAFSALIESDVELAGLNAALKENKEAVLQAILQNLELEYVAVRPQSERKGFALGLNQQQP